MACAEEKKVGVCWCLPVPVAAIALGITGLVGVYRQVRNKFDLNSLNRDFENKEWRRYRRQFAPQKDLADLLSGASKKTQGQSGY